MVLWLGKAEERNWMRPDTSWDYLKSSYSLGKHFHPFTTGFWVHMVRFSDHFLWPDTHSFYPFLSDTGQILGMHSLNGFVMCSLRLLTHPPVTQWLSMYSYLPTAIAFLGPKLRRMTFSLSLPHLPPSSNCWDLPALVVFAQVNKIVLGLCPSLLSTVVIKTITKNDLERRVYLAYMSWSLSLIEGRQGMN